MSKLFNLCLWTCQALTMTTKGHLEVLTLLK